MPWKLADVDKHKKGLTDKLKELWVQVANDALKRCEEKGQGDCDARAIKQANAVVGRAKKEARGEGVGVGGEKQGDGGAQTCVCPECGAEKEHERGKPCAEVKCPKCGVAMVGKEQKEAGFDEWYELLDEDTQQLLENHIHGLKSALIKERKARKELEREARRKLPEASEILGDVIPLVEKAFTEDDTIPIKIMQPGWGQSGYYPAEILERDGPKVFTDGVQMFWDHPTETEERERPERSLRDLAGKLTEDARWDPNGAYGPGLYSQGEVFGPFKDALEELAPHIGLSIFARGKATEGEAEDREGMIIEEITSARSVDFVTVPGAGGQILQLFESARGKPAPKKKQEADMTDEKLKQESEATKAENARLHEALLLRKAKDVASKALAEQDMAEMTRERIVETVAKNPPHKDGELDEEAFATAIEEAVKKEMAYLADLTESGAIRGMGASEGGDEEGDEKQLTESWVEQFEAQGMSTEEAEKMAKIAVRGR